MRCFIDSNILISAGLFPGSVPAAALEKAIQPDNMAYVCDYSLDEVHRVISRKFPDRASDLEKFLYRLLFSVQLVQTPNDIAEVESRIRDANDRPILRAALKANCDVLITGDKDFLESGIARPRIMSPSEFLEMK